MSQQLFNIAVSILVLCGSIHMIYYTYKEPSSISTNSKGYFGGGGMAVLSLMSLFGKFNLLNTFIEIFRTMLKLKDNESAIKYVAFSVLIFIIVGLIYYRPDKIIKKYQAIEKDNKDAKIKLISGCFLFYYAFTLTTAYTLLSLLKF